jgi:cytochrome c553
LPKTAESPKLAMLPVQYFQIDLQNHREANRKNAAILMNPVILTKNEKQRNVNS